MEGQKYCLECGRPLKERRTTFTIVALAVVLIVLLFSFYYLEMDRMKLLDEVEKKNLELIDKTNQINQLNEEMNRLEVEKNSLKTELEKRVLKDFKTEAELKSFLSKDKTDEMEISDSYPPAKFAADLKFNAMKEGYDLKVLVVYFSLREHPYIPYFVAFYNLAKVNGETVYINPRNDGVYQSMIKMLVEDLKLLGVNAYAYDITIKSWMEI